MSYQFKGIITDANPQTFASLNSVFVLKVFPDYNNLVIIERDEEYSAVMDIARKLSGKLLGNNIASIDYGTWAGMEEWISAAVFRNGVNIDGLCFTDIENSRDPFFRVMLELGVVLPDSGYFAPFDRRQTHHVGG
jgi:hypothetical protein